MERFEFKITFALILLVSQIACRQTQSVSKENNKTEIKIGNQVNSAVNYTKEQKEEIDYFAHLKPKHKEVLQEWLKKKPYLRPAVEEIDSTLDKRTLENIHKKKWTQFYTTADINKDGKEDFAVLLVNTNDKRKFAISIFNGNFTKGQSPNLFDDNLNEVSEAFLEYENKFDGYFSSKSYLLLGDGKRNGCAGYIPKKESYKTIVCI